MRTDRRDQTAQSCIPNIPGATTSEDGSVALVVVINVSRFNATTEPLGTLEEIELFAVDLATGLEFCTEPGGC